MGEISEFKKRAILQGNDEKFNTNEIDTELTLFFKEEGAKNSTISYFEYEIKWIIKRRLLISYFNRILFFILKEKKREYSQ